MAEYVNLENDGPIRRMKMMKIGKYSFSSIEIKHLMFAMIMIILTLFAFQEKSLIFSSKIFSLQFVLFFIAYFFTIGFGFILHELGHKLVAQHYGFISEFRADFKMLIIIFFIALFSPFIFLSPGAVMVLGRPTIKQNGIISVAGPIVNLVLSLIFIFLALFVNLGNYGNYVVNLGIWINAFLGVFNMLPFWVLDGKKVLAWDKKTYFLVMGSLLLILFGAFGGYF